MKKKLSVLKIGLFVWVILLTGLLSFSISQEISKSKTIYQIPVTGTIDLGLSSFIKRAVAQAKEKKVDAVIIEIDTLGGRVDGADEIVMAIETLSPTPVYAYVTNTAWSAGALVAFSCDEIIMKKASSIGSAEPRTMSIGGISGQQATDEKMISALRAKFKATAEANNHSIKIAEAMVDKDIEIVQALVNDKMLLMTRAEFEAKKQKNEVAKDAAPQVISQQGKLLNLTAQEAVEIGLAKKIVADETEFLSIVKEKISNNLKQTYEIIKPNLTWSENLVRALTHPIVSSLLLTLGFLGIIFELKIPGWGISGTIGIICLIFFFWGHYLVGLANWVDIIIFIVGVVLLCLELFVIPGFGIAGASGILFMISGLILTLLKHPLTFPSFEFQTAFMIISYSFITTFILTIVAIKFIPKTSLWKRVSLKARETKAQGFQTKSLPKEITIGLKGSTKTILRPSGRANFDNNIIIDVTTFGEFIEKDESIVVAKIEGNKVFVEKPREA